MDSQDIQVKEKQEMTQPAEHTRPGPIFTPAVDIFDTDEAITVLADMPGARADSIQIDLRDNILTLQGEADSPEGTSEVDVLREYRTGRFFRQFTMSEIIDQSRIEASLTDGVLRLVLPKVERMKPRQISVKAG
ncbi:MAG: Hsp20/alpha crystallin family protein [Deltaproteobacteria bacterium]|nr:Hsp20/alpha crystallin family protein [Deltaproteobacteria bacterium]MBW2308008.1 Hsp20/alpha crystallin family protein [Deltaproteobacteria bacterium]